MTQKELARKVSITPVWLSNIKTGKATPSDEVAINLSKILGVSVRVFFGPADIRISAIDNFLKKN